LKKNPKTPKGTEKHTKTEGARTKTKKTLKPKKNPIETQKSPRKKYIYKIRCTPKPDPKLNEFRFSCQISPVSVSSGVKFNLTTVFHGSDF
jgi:hypothetical protein